MQPSTSSPLLVHWYAALESAEGIWLTSPDIPRLTQGLYRARTLVNDPRLSDLSLRPSRRNPTGELWIVKNLRG